MKKDIYFLGDIHGEFEIIFKWLVKYNIENSVIIQVGDFGRGFRDDEDHLLNQLSDRLKERNCHLYIIRGNHDNPEFFKGKKEHNYSNVILLKDYTILEIEGLNFLFVGGAISIDRKQRTLGSSYWKKEIFNLDIKKLEFIKNLDIVVTHTTPSFAYPTLWSEIVYNFADRDPGLYQELPNERKMLDEMHNILIKNNKIKKWYYGHFHSSKTEIHNEIEFILLGVNEFKLMSNE